ncbi:MAG: type IV pilin [Candidatus Methanospirareceae archaeon]
MITRNIRKDKRGVSPVIGVILMVAATIVIAGVVMGMLGGFGPPRRTYTVTATASEAYDLDGDGNTPDIEITYHGGPDNAYVDYLNVSVDGTAVTLGTGWGSPDNNNTDVKPGVSVIVDSGDIATISTGPNNDHVVVTATFIDGSAQVILDTMV